MAVKQLSIFVENKEGKLVTITDSIAEAGIDIRAMSVADTQDFGIFRLIVTDPEKAKLAKIVHILARHNINIEYMYAFITVSKKFASVVLRVEDNDKAETILTENGIRLLEEKDIVSM